MDFARFEFQMARPGEDGVPMGAKVRAVNPERMDDAPPLPLGTEHIWDWFNDLNSARTGNGFGLNPLTFTEISAWCALTGNTPTPWEVSMLKLLDACYLKEMAHER